MAPQMKGLHQFILDLRNANSQEQEHKRINLEINNINAKFASANLSSYQKKKYVCKILYIHLLGLTDEVKFGLDHAFAMLSSSDYSEKSLAYLAVSILLTNESPTKLDFVHHLISVTYEHLVRDLSANLEDVNALALQFIASTFNIMHSSSSDIVTIVDSDSTAEQWQQIIDLVYGMCVSPIIVPVIKKKALIALLVLLKLYPSFILANDTWFPRLLSLLDDKDLSVVLCVIPLVTYLSRLRPNFAKSIIPSATTRLYALVVDQACPPDYLYYSVPAPWLVIKLSQLIEHLFLLGSSLPNSSSIDVSALDQQTVFKLRQFVSTSIQNASKPVKGHPDRNSRSSILFQAVSIASFLDASNEAINGAMHALVQLLDSLETNTRYLVLDALIKLLARSHSKFSFKEYLPQVILSLQDRDVSVRKKTLDLLYTSCDESTYSQIVSHLLDYFPTADISLKADISIKIAVLAERFATDSIWYVSTMLRLLSLGGQSSKTVSGMDGVPHASEVWERIIQIIVNNEDIQKMASKYVFNSLKKIDGIPAENIVKVAAFVLGDFGHLLEDPDNSSNQFSIENQFRLLFDVYGLASVSTRPLILNAFVKFVRKTPDGIFVPEVLDLLEAETLSLDLEIQTRASEYLKVATLLTSGSENDMNFARSLIQPLPPFESKQNRLINHMGSLSMIQGASSSSVNVSNIPKNASKETRASLTRKDSRVSDLSEESDTDADPFGDATLKSPPLSPNWYEGYHRMLQFDTGIFYEDQLIKLTYRIRRDGANLTLIFTVINIAAKTAAASITAFTVADIHNLSGKANAKYTANLTKVPDSTIDQKTTMEIDVKIRDVMSNEEAPIVSMTYKCSGSFNTLNLKIPLVLAKTLSGTSMSSIDDFKKRWLQIGELLGTEKGEKRGLVVASHRRTSSTIAKMLERLGLATIQSTSDEPHSHLLVMSAGISKTLTANCGVLVTMKSTTQESVQFEIIVRSTRPGVAFVIYETIRELLAPRH